MVIFLPRYTQNLMLRLACDMNLCMFVLTLLHSHSPHPSLCLHSCWSHRSASFSFSIHCIPDWRMTLKSVAKHTWFLPSSWQSSSISCIFTNSLFCPLISSQDGLRQLSKYQTKFFIYLLLRNSYPSFNNQFNRFYCVGFHKPPLLILFFFFRSFSEAQSFSALWSGYRDVSSVQNHSSLGRDSVCFWCVHPHPLSMCLNHLMFPYINKCILVPDQCFSKWLRDRREEWKKKLMACYL